MQFTKVRDVKVPTRAHPYDAGIDFYVPMNIDMDTFLLKNPTLNSWNFREDSKEIILLPQQRVLIPSGIHVKVPQGFALIAFNKSGISTAKGLVVGGCVVDIGYEGEVHISLINTSDKDVVIKFGDKVVQFILLPVNFEDPVEIPSKEELYKDSESQRKANGFGSTDHK